MISSTFRAESYQPVQNFYTPSLWKHVLSHTKFTNNGVHQIYVSNMSHFYPKQTMSICVTSEAVCDRDFWVLTVAAPYLPSDQMLW